MAYFVNSSGVQFEVLSKGEHTIGRGPLLKITDKRVSRNHATVKVNDDNAVSICPRHTNPCYYKPSGRDEQIQLKKDVWQTLSDGDQISILHYNIKDLVYTLRNTVDSKEETLIEDATLKVEEEKEEDDEEVSNLDDSDTVKEKPLIDSDKRSNPSNSSMFKESSTTEKKKKTRVLPAWMLSASSTVQTTNDEDTKKLSPPPKKKKTNTKTSGSSSSAASATDMKKTNGIKTSKSSPKPKKTTPKDNKASPPTPIDSDESTEPDKKKTLPACPYGKSCYRKNPVHFEEYTHNDDEEEENTKGDSNDEADKPECPYGTSCYRKNPLHRQQFNHSKAPASDSRKRTTRTSTRSTRGKKPKKSVLVGDSDDDGEANSYDYNDSFIDDAKGEGEDDSSTSYGADSDEDADWAPMEDSEEISELLSDAKEFVSNSKMQK